MTGFALALLPVIAIVALGRLLAWRRTVAPEGWRAIEKLAYVLLFPALIIDTLASAPFDEAPWRMMAALIAAQLLMAVIGVAGGRLARAEGPAIGVIVQSNVRWNTFVALSLAGGLYGEDGLALTAVAAAAMIPTANMLSVWALARHAQPADGAPAPNVLLQFARNPLVIACAIGGALNLAGLAPSGVIGDGFDILGRATIALGLLSAGAGVDLAALRRAGLRTLVWSLVRLLVLPAAAVAAALALHVGGLQLFVLAIAAATPTATNGYILARQMGGDAPLSANLIAVQTVLAALTMPLVFWAAQALSPG